MATSLYTDLALDALEMGIWARTREGADLTGLVHHSDYAEESELSRLRLNSDRGSQFRSNAFVRTLKGNGLKGSMGRVGACADNAAMESFFSLLQKNVLDSQRWSTRADLRLAIVTWIEKTYHRKRRQRRLGRLTPVEFEILNTGLKAA